MEKIIKANICKCGHQPLVTSWHDDSTGQVECCKCFSQVTRGGHPIDRNKRSYCVGGKKAAIEAWNEMNPEVI